MLNCYCVVKKVVEGLLLEFFMPNLSRLEWPLLLLLYFLNAIVVVFVYVALF